MNDATIEPEPTGIESTTDNRKMARAAAGVSLLTGIGYLTGIVTKMVLARLLGTLPTNNAFNYGHRLTQDIFRSWDKLIRPTFLPALSWERDRVGEEDAWTFTNTIINLQAVLLAVVVLVLMVFSRHVVGVLTNFEEESATLASRFLMLLAPGVLFLSLATTGYMLLNSYKRFHLAAFGDHVFVKLFPFLSLVALYWALGITALILGIVAGAVAKLALYLWGLRDYRAHYRPRLKLRSPAMRKMMWLMLPLSVGVVVSFARNRIEDYFLTDVLKGRAMTLVTNAKAAVDIPVIVFPVALSIAIFPFMSDYFLKKRHKDLLAVLGKGIRIIFLAFLPLTVGLIVLAHPTVDVVFGGGKFTPDDVRYTSDALRFYAVGYVVFGLEILLLQFFYAAHDTIRPTVTGVATSALQILILYLTVDALGVVSFTLAYSASKTIKVLLLFGLLAWVYPHAALWGPMLKRTGSALAKIATATAAMGAVVWLLGAVLIADDTARLLKLVYLVVTAGVGGVVFVAGVHLLGVEEWRQALGWVKGKLKR